MAAPQPSKHVALKAKERAEIRKETRKFHEEARLQRLPVKPKGKRKGIEATTAEAPGTA